MVVSADLLEAKGMVTLMRVVVVVVGSSAGRGEVSRTVTPSLKRPQRAARLCVDR